MTKLMQHSRKALGMSVAVLALLGVMTFAGCESTTQVDEGFSEPITQPTAGTDADVSGSSEPGQTGSQNNNEQNEDFSIPISAHTLPESTAPSANATIPIASTDTGSQQAANAISNLGVNLIRKLAADGANIMVSPFSISAALSLVTSGAEGETQEQLEGALGMTAEQANNAFATFKNLSESAEIAVRDENGEQTGTKDYQAFAQANSLWLANNLVLNEPFREIAATDYDAEVQVVDGVRDATLINDWFNEHTKGMITNIVPDDHKVVGMDVINALAFDCPWNAPFYDDEVVPGVFTSAAGSTQDATYLDDWVYAYLETPQATGFVKKYADTRFAFAALLPVEGMTPEELLAELSGEDVRAVLEQVDTNREVHAILPEFESTYNCSLNDALKSFGVQDAFQRKEADFSGITNAPLFIDQVLHKTYIAVDRAGTKAAAVTAIIVDAAASANEDPTPVVNLNRPFVYVIFATEDTVPLFIGIVNSLA